VVEVRVKDLDGAAAELVAAPAEDDIINAPGENARDEELACRLVEEPADELGPVHEVGRIYDPPAAK
jgi:hypothetical protein